MDGGGDTLDTECIMLDGEDLTEDLTEDIGDIIGQDTDITGKFQE